MPNPLPLALMKVQRLARRASSPALSVAGVNAVSVPPIAVTKLWIFVPHAASPGANPASEIDGEELVQLPPTGAVETSLTTTEVGTAGVVSNDRQASCAAASVYQLRRMCIELTRPKANRTVV